MSDSQKARMEQKAYGMTGRDYERKARKLISATNCPFAAVVASSGGPSTENVFGCTFYADHPAFFGWDPDCPALGRRDHCPLHARLYKHKALGIAIKLRRIQLSLDLYEICIEKNQGSWKPKPLEVSNELSK